MKPFYRNLLICFLLIVPLYLAGTWVYELIFDRLVQVKMAVNTIDGVAMAAIKFSLITALIPFGIVLCWHFAPVVENMKRTWTALIIVGCSVFFLILRIISVGNLLRMSRIPGIAGKEEYYYYYAFERLNLESYYLGGLMTGIVIVYFGFQSKRTLKAA